MSIKVLLFLLIQQCLCQLKRPPMVEQKPNLLNSFVPASMQIIAYVTELMKYDINPANQNRPTTTTTTTMAPTRSHKPGVFAPSTPPPPTRYNSEFLSYQDYIERLLNPPNDYNYFDRYKYPLMDEFHGRQLIGVNNEQLPENFDLLVGKEVDDVLKLANRIDYDDDDNIDNDRDGQVYRFLKDYDDSDFRDYLRQQRKQPPTRAYVSLLSIYDLMSKEAKKLGFGKFNGYTENILAKLIETSTGTSTDQLRFVLQQNIDQQEVNTPQLVKRVKELITDLKNDSSYISSALRYIPPLKFAL